MCDKQTNATLDIRLGSLTLSNNAQTEWKGVGTYYRTCKCLSCCFLPLTINEFDICGFLRMSYT